MSTFVKHALRYAMNRTLRQLRMGATIAKDPGVVRLWQKSLPQRLVEMLCTLVTITWIIGLLAICFSGHRLLPTVNLFVYIVSFPIFMLLLVPAVAEVARLVVVLTLPSQTDKQAYEGLFPQGEISEVLFITLRRSLANAHCIPKDRITSAVGSISLAMLNVVGSPLANDFITEVKKGARIFGSADSMDTVELKLLSDCESIKSLFCRSQEIISRRTLEGE